MNAPFRIRPFGFDQIFEPGGGAFDDIDMARWPSHALTTIQQPVTAMLAATVALAKKLALHAGDEPFVQRFTPGDLVERSTTRSRNAQ